MTREAVRLLAASMPAAVAVWAALVAGAIGAALGAWTVWSRR